MASPSNFTLEQFTPTDITATLPIVVTVPDSDFSQGQAIRFTQFYALPLAVATGMYELNNKLYYIANPTTDTFTLTDKDGTYIDGRGFTAFTGLGNPQITLTGPDLFVENPAPTPPP